MRLWCAAPRWCSSTGKALTVAALTASSGLCSVLVKSSERQASHTPPGSRARSDTQSAWSSGAAIEPHRGRDVRARLSRMGQAAVGGPHSSRSRVSGPKRGATTGIHSLCTPRPICSRSPRGETAWRTPAARARPHSGCRLFQRPNAGFNTWEERASCFCWSACLLVR